LQLASHLCVLSIKADEGSHRPTLRDRWAAYCAVFAEAAAGCASALILMVGTGWSDDDTQGDNTQGGVSDANAFV
jgi:hypothetical protein